MHAIKYALLLACTYGRLGIASKSPGLQLLNCQNAILKRPWLQRQLVVQQVVCWWHKPEEMVAGIPRICTVSLLVCDE